MSLMTMTEKSRALCHQIEKLDASPQQTIVSLMVASLSMDIEFLELSEMAEEKGWNMPTTEDVFGDRAWIAYWQSCRAYENNPNCGRPVVPHRSGGVSS